MWRTFLFSSLAVTIFTLFSLQAWEELEQAKSLKVVLLTVESLRYDLVTEQTAPQLLAAAKSGIHFSHHRSSSAWTGSNIVTLLSGLSPFSTGVHTRGQSVDPNCKLPLEQLREDGYQIAGLQSFMAMDIYKNLGLEVTATTPDPQLWLALQQQKKQPFVLWYHYLHTHLPYGNQPGVGADALPPKFSRIVTQSAIHHDEVRYTTDDITTVHDLQLANIAEFDRWFGKFWSFFQQGGLYHDTILVVTADHGDEHGERGMVGHASTTLAGHLHEEIVRVPLFLWLPEKMHKRLPDIPTNLPTSHMDIMPTLLSLLGYDELHMDGHSLFAPNRPTTWYGMTSSGGFNEPDPKAIRYYEYSWLEYPWKLRLRHYNGGREERFLYHLGDDPGEKHNLANREKQLTTTLASRLAPLIADRTSRPYIELTKGESGTGAPVWRTPAQSGAYSFAMLDDTFTLSWSGNQEDEYILEYEAGYGRKKLEGYLRIRGNSKDFGRIDKRYWQTWIVPHSPYRLRVRAAQGPWSDWLTLEALP